MTREMRSRGPMRLGTRLFLAALALIVLVLAVIISLDIRAIVARHQADVDQAQHLAGGVAGTFDAFARNIETTTLATSLALAGIEGPLDQETAGPLLASLLVEGDVWEYFFLTDTDGMVVASGSGEGTGIDLSGRPYIQALQDGAPSVWSDGVLGIQTGRLTVSFGRPVTRADGTVAGYLLAAFHPQRVVERLPFDPGPLRLTVLDRRGTVLLQTGLAGEEPGTLVDMGDYPEVFAGETVLIDGEVVPFVEGRRYGALVPMQRTGWVVAATARQDLLESAVVARVAERIVGAGVVVLLAGLVFGAVSGRITGPLESLARSAAAISRGERPAIPEVDADPEVMRLAAAMRTMNDSIAEREDGLRRLVEEQRFLARATALLVASLDYEETLAALCRMAVPELADWCAIDTAEEDTLRRVAGYHPDPEVAARIMALPFEPGTSARGRLRVLYTGEAEVYREVTDEALVAMAQSGEHLSLLRSLGLRAAMMLPLTARGRTLGVMTFGSASRPYTEADAELARQFVWRASLAVDNARLYAEARDAVRLRNEFLSVATHEVRSPVTAIKGQVQLMQRLSRSGKLDDGQIDGRFASLDQSIARLVGLMHDLLDVSRIQTGRLMIADKPVDLRMLVFESAQAYDLELPAGTHIRTLLPEEPVVVRGDAGRLQQVIVNLLDNAVKYSPPEGTITVELAVRDDQVEITVSDEGIGFGPGEAEAIFEPFRRASNTVNLDVPGTGLGLHICRRIVEAHGGSMDAESAGEGAGATFRVRLPWSEVDEGAEPLPVQEG